MWMNYKLPIVTGEVLSILEKQEEWTKEVYEYFKAHQPHIIRFLTVIHRQDMEDAKLGNDIVFRKRLRSDLLRIQREISGLNCSERASCNSYHKKNCSLDLSNSLLKKTPRCFSVEDVDGREYMEMAIEAIRTNSVLVVILADSIPL